jgi:predicted GNAT superfamily acetyltransferase
MLPAVMVTVRDVRGADELRACQALQRRAWGITEDGYVLPVATMAAAQKVGGSVLGAFDPNTGDLLGFAFAFLGRVRGQLVLYSQLTGVDPDRQGGGIGRTLKFEQRRRAREAGLTAVVWAFDPLQASNASFNLAVLGATSRTYEVDLYGSRSDALNAGLATDRLLVEWPTRVEPQRVAVEGWLEAPDLLVDGVDRVGRDTRLRLSIPTDLAETKVDPAQAQRWQLQVRTAFQAAFDAGYVAVGFARGEDEAAYLLERRT